MVNYLLNYLPTDAILYQSDVSVNLSFEMPQIQFFFNYSYQKDDELYQTQCNQWDPIIEWFNGRYGTEIEKCRDIVAPPMKPGTQMKISKHLLSHNLAALHGTEYITHG